MTEVTVTTETPPDIQNQVSETLVAGVVAIADQQAAMAQIEAANAIAANADNVKQISQELEELERNEKWHVQEILSLQSQVASLNNQVRELQNSLLEMNKLTEPLTPSETNLTPSDTLELIEETETEALPLNEAESPALVEIPTSREKSFRLI